MKILIVKCSSLGDIIHAFPVLEYLKSVYPGCSIDWVVERSFMELFHASPHINRLILIDTKKWKKSIWHSCGEVKKALNELRKETYDFVLDLQGNLKSGLITKFAKSSLKFGFGLGYVAEWPNILMTHHRFNPPKGLNIRGDLLYLTWKAVEYHKTKAGMLSDVTFPGNSDFAIERLKRLSDVECSYLDEILAPLKNTKIKILVAFGSNWTNKQIPPSILLPFLKSLVIRLEGGLAFIWGSEREKKSAETMVSEFAENAIVVDKLPLYLLEGLMQKVDLVISADSLVLHLAGVTSTPTYSIFGPSLGLKYNPSGKKNHCFQGRCPYGVMFEKRCPKLRTCTTASCIRDINLEALQEDFFMWWQEMSD